MQLTLATVGVFVLVALFLNLNRKVVTLMADVKSFEADIDAVAAGVAELAAEIASLKASGGVVSQEQLDALDAKVKDILAAVQAAK